MTDRRVLKQQYRQAMNRAGVYAIRNRVTGRALVEGSMNAQGSLNRHQFELRHGTHLNKLLGQEWSLHGESTFTFEVLDIIEPPDDPAFDLAGELAQLVALWRQEIPCQGDAGYEATPVAS